MAFSTPLRENVEQAKSILKKLNIPTTDEGYQTIRGMLEKKMGWVGMFTRFYYQQGVSLDDLAGLFDQLVDLESFLARLPKTVVKYNDYEELSDDLNRLDVTRKASHLYQELTADHKKYVKALKGDDRAKFDKLAYAFYALTPTQQKKLLQKLKSFQPSGLLAGFENFIDALSNNFDAELVKEAVEATNGGAAVVYENEEKGYLIVQLHTYEANVLLNETTLWCIRNSTTHWNNYVGGNNVNSTQYTIYNFNLSASEPMSMVGVTVKRDHTMRTAHARYDESVPQAQVVKMLLDAGTTWKILAPLSDEEYQRRERERRRAEAVLTLVLQHPGGKRNYEKLKELLQPSDMVLNGRSLFQAAFEAGDTTLLQLFLDATGKSVQDALSVKSSGILNTLFSNACSQSDIPTVEYILAKGYDPNIHPGDVLVLVRKYMEHEEFPKAQRVLESYRASCNGDTIPWNTMVDKVFMNASNLGRHTLRAVKWLLKTEWVPMSVLQIRLANVIGNVSLAGIEFVQLLLDYGVPVNGAAAGAAAIEYHKIRQNDHPDKLPTRVFLQQLIEENAMKMSMNDSPFGKMAMGYHETMMEYIDMGVPDSTNLTISLQAIQFDKIDNLDRILSRLEKTDELNKNPAVTKELLGAIVNHGSMKMLEYIHERGLRIGGALVKKFTSHDIMYKAFDYLHKLTNNKEKGYEKAKYLINLGYGSNSQDIIEAFMEYACNFADLDMVRRLRPDELPGRANLLHLIKSCKEAGTITGLIKYIAGAESPVSTATMSFLINQLYVVPLMPEEYLARIAELKTAPLQAYQLNNALSADQPALALKLAKLNFSATLLVSAVVHQGFHRCAHALMDSTDPVVAAKIRREKTAILAAIQDAELEPGNYVREVLNGTNEQRVVRSWRHFRP